MYGSGWEMEATHLEQTRGWGFYIFSVGQQNLPGKQSCKALSLGQRECTCGKEQISDTGPSIPWGFPSLVPVFTLLVNAGFTGQTNVLITLLTASLKTTLFVFCFFFFPCGCNILFVNLASSWMHHKKSSLSLFSLQEAACSVCLCCALPSLKLSLEHFILRIIVPLAAFVLF